MFVLQSIVFPAPGGFHGANFVHIYFHHGEIKDKTDNDDKKEDEDKNRKKTTKQWFVLISACAGPGSQPIRGHPSSWPAQWLRDIL